MKITSIMDCTSFYPDNDVDILLLKLILDVMQFGGTIEFTDNVGDVRTIGFNAPDEEQSV